MSIKHTNVLAVLIIIIGFSNISNASCHGHPTTKCDEFGSWSDNSKECNNHYKTGSSGMGSQCYWKKSAWGGYCLASLTFCIVERHKVK